MKFAFAKEHPDTADAVIYAIKKDALDSVDLGLDQGDAVKAAAAAARKNLTGRMVTVGLPGGDLTIEWRESCLASVGSTTNQKLAGRVVIITERRRRRRKVVIPTNENINPFIKYRFCL